MVNCQLAMGNAHTPKLSHPLIIFLLLLTACRAWAIPVDAYRQRLDEAIAALSSIEGSRGPTALRQALDRASQQLAPVRSAELPDGSSFPLSFGWIEEAKEQAPDRDSIKEIKETLILYRDEIDQVLRGALQPESRAQTWAKEIVSRREFHLHIPWIQLFIAKVLDALARFLSEHTSAHGLKVMYRALVTVCVIVVLGVLIYLTRSIRRTLVPEVERTSSTSEDLFEQYHSSREWQALAAEQAARGDLRLAVRCLYHSVLALLDEAQIIRYDRSRTNWEHLRAVRLKASAATANELMTPLTDATRFFERKWYGLEPCALEEYSHYRSNLSALATVVRSHTPTRSEVTEQ